MTTEPQDFAFGSPAPLALQVSPDIERAILQLVVDGFERWQAGGFIRAGDHEDDYTVRLYACMKEIRRKRNMALVPIYQHVEPSDKMLGGQEDPARAPRIDMVVSWDQFNDDAYLSIECKRVAPDDLARLYVVCGIDRFVRAYYGAKAQTGAMVGYLIRGAPGTVLRRVNNHVQRTPAMGRSHTLMQSNAIGWLNTVFESNHSRRTPYQPIRLTHLFFDMTRMGPTV